MNPLENFLKMYRETRTQKNYRWILNQYFREIGKKPDDYIQKNMDYREEIKNWWELHLDEVPKTRHLKLAVIKGFFESQDICYPKNFWVERRREKKGRRAATLDRTPTANEMKSILMHGDVKDKAFYLFLLSSGTRVDEALKIKPSMLDLNHDPPIIRLSANITKNGDPRITFITQEAKNYLLEWMKLKDDFVKKAIRRTGHLCRKKPNDDRLFPFSYDLAWVRWIWLIKKAGYDQRDDTTNRYILHIHVLRKYFLSQLKLEIPEVIPEALSGHEKYLDESYRRFTQEQLEEYYKKGMKRLIIFETIPDLTNINQEMQELREKNKKLEDDVALLSTTVKTLENSLKIKKLEEKIKS